MLGSNCKDQITHFCKDMEETELFAFYGSLRTGMSNYRIYQDVLEYVSTNRISGYELYALSDYPYAVFTGNAMSSMVMEIFRVKSKHAKLMIHKLEIDAGYYFKLIEVDGNKVGIYLFSKPGNDTKVESGDWVKFYGNSEI